MADESELLARLRRINDTASFNRWLGLEVVRARRGEVELRLERRAEHGQYADLLHVGVVAALIDTCCGFAGATLADSVIGSHFSIDCLAPAAGASFLAKGRVVKAGRRQIFTAAELHSVGAKAALVATGTALLIPLGEAPARSAA